jgi:hypothetical protein
MPFDLELEQAVQKIQKGDKPMEKSFQYLEMKKFANRQRLPAESESQAFTKFITTDPYGKQLYAQYKQTRGASVPFAKTASGHNAGADGDSTHQTGQSGNEGDESEALKKLRLLAEMLRQEQPELSKQQALSKVLTTVEGAQLYLKDKAARLSRAVA